MGEQFSFNLEAINPPRQELVELWTPDDIFAALIKDGADILSRFSEDNRIEFKSARYGPKLLGDFVSMWANTQPFGGLI